MWFDIRTSGLWPARPFVGIIKPEKGRPWGCAMAQTDDLALYTQWRQAKDREAFQELVSRHTPMVYGVCRRILTTQSETEEATIEVFQMLAHAPAGPQTHLATWLHAAATTRALQRIRLQRQRPPVEPKAPPSTEVNWETLQTEIDSALLAVPWQSRIPLVGQYIDDKTQSEIAEETGLDRQRVIADGVTGLEALRKELGNRGLALTESRLKELLATHMIEPVPSTLVSRLSEQAIAEPLAGRRLAAGLEVDETIKRKSAAAWALPLAAAVAVIAGIAIWMAGRGAPEPPVKPPETGRVETAEAPSPGPENPPAAVRPGAMPGETRTPENRGPRTASTTPTEAAQPVTYRGSVRDVKGNPIADAKVFRGSLPPSPETADAKVKTSPTGQFELADVPADTRQISVWHEDYKPATVPVSSETASPLEIALTPAARVTGIITYIGSPVPEQTVELVNAAGKTIRTETGKNGVYTFSGADPGTVQLRAQLEAMEPVNRRRTMYSTAVLETGLTTSADFTFGALDAAAEGTVTFNDEPVRGAKLVARVQTPSGGEEHFDASVQSDGTYLVESLPAGPTILQLQGLRVGRTELLRSISVQTRSGQTAPCDFVLSGDSTVVVQVSGVVPGATGIVAAIEPGTSLLDFDWPDYELTPVNLLARIPLTQDGEYTLEGLEAAGCTICAYAKPPAPPPATETPGAGQETPAPLYDAAGITLQAASETVIVLQLR